MIIDPFLKKNGELEGRGYSNLADTVEKRELCLARGQLQRLTRQRISDHVIRLSTSSLILTVTIIVASTAQSASFLDQ